MSFENTNGNSVKDKYAERYRPHIHFTPESMWMNDPNGLVYYEGEYHLFYQYHPNSKKWGPMHWGHAKSKDLFNWKHQPIALYPDEKGMMFSGSAVVDENDTSKFFHGGHGLVAMFTHADGDIQRQSIAFSRDKGETWEKYEGNPVIENPGIKDFRDPKVLWHEEIQLWIMVLTAGRLVWFYTSPNLKDWTYVSKFGEGWGAQEGVWECPDLFPLEVEGINQTKWVLQVGIDAGGPAGGSGTQYFVGDFDGRTFVPDQKKEEVKWMDVGKDFYAAQSFSDVPHDRRIVLAWMSNWQYANEVPTDPWRSAMSLPRELSLTKNGEGYQLLQQPVRDLDALKITEQVKQNVELSENQTLELKQPQGPFELDVIMQNEEDNQFEILLFMGERSQFIIGVDVLKREFYIRRDLGDEEYFSKHFAGEFSQNISDLTDLSRLTVICDHSTVEVFVDGGKLVSTNLYLPAKSEYHSIGFISLRRKLKVDTVKIKEFYSTMVHSL